LGLPWEGSERRDEREGAMGLMYKRRCPLLKKGVGGIEIQRAR